MSRTILAYKLAARGRMTFLVPGVHRALGLRRDEHGMCYAVLLVDESSALINAQFALLEEDEVTDLFGNEQYLGAATYESGAVLHAFYCGRA